MSALNLIRDVAFAFFDLVVRIFPYFLLGSLTAAAFTFLSPRWTGRVLGGGTRSVLLGAVLAAVLPGCSCATIPMTEGLRRQGAKVRNTDNVPHDVATACSAHRHPYLGDAWLAICGRAGPHPFSRPSSAWSASEPAQ